MTQPRQPTNRIQSVDAFRVLAIAAVIALHTAPHTGPDAVGLRIDARTLCDQLERFARAARGSRSARRGRPRSDVDRELAIAIGERGGVNLLELDCAAQHPLFPGVMLGVALELRHHFLRE